MLCKCGHLAKDHSIAAAYLWVVEYGRCNICDGKKITGLIRRKLCRKFKPSRPMGAL